MFRFLFLLFILFCVQTSLSAQTWYEKGKAAENSNQKIEFFTKALNEEKKDNWTYYRRAWAYMNLKRYPVAIADFKLALKAQGSLEIKHCYTGLGWAYYDLEDYANAKKYAKKSADVDPSSYTAYNILGWIAIAEDDYQNAVTQFSKYIQYNSKSATGYNDRSYAWSLIGNYQKVLDDCNKGLAIDPDHERMAVRKGLALVKLGKTAEGVALLKDKIEYKDDDPISLSNLGKMFYSASDYSTAIEFHTKGIKLYEEKIKIDPKFIKQYKDDVYNIYMNRGDAYEALKQWQHALQNYTKASTIDAKNHRAWIEIGEVHTFQDNYKEATQAYEKAFLVKPDHKGGWTNLGYCYDQLGLVDKAISAYSRGIKANPEDGLLLNNRGYAYLLKGWMAKSKADLEKAIQVQPEVVMSHVSLGEYYWKNSDYDAAIKKFDEAIAMENGSTSAYQVAYFTRGRCYHRKKDLARAISDYELSTTYDPKDIQSWEWLGIAHYENKEECKAYKELKKALQLDQNNRVKEAKNAAKYLGKLTGNPCQ